MIILGLGSNLSSSFGDRFQNIEKAIYFFEHHGIKIIKKSSYYESLSYPDQKNPKFINIVIAVESELVPEQLISILLFIEEKLERKRNKKNDPRTCDIDIIDYNNKVSNFRYKNLNFDVPHKELHRRNFVLFPLREIFPKWKHPVTNEDINLLIEKLSEHDKMSILKTEKS